jgi:hypothetical protein
MEEKEKLQDEMRRIIEKLSSNLHLKNLLNKDVFQNWD